MEWTLNPQGATIGYNAANNYFENHPNTGSSLAHEIACLNTPHSKWYNVVYKLSVGAPGVTLPPPPTVEPRRLQCNHDNFSCMITWDLLVCNNYEKCIIIASYMNVL